MKLLRLAALLVVCSSCSFAVNKDLVALQRDLEDKINSVQNDMDAKLANLAGMVTAMQSDTRRTADQVATLQETVGNNVTKSLTPVAGLSTKVDGMGDDVRSLRDALADLSSRLERMDAKMTDLKNQLQVLQSPPPAPAASGQNPLTPGGSSALLPANGQLGAPASPGGPTPPMGMTAEKSYNDALTDLQTQKTDLAYNEFQQYLTYFPNTELAANAQYYIGEIDYNRGKYTESVKAFDDVLEHYPNNPKTSDAHLMKAYALLKANQRNRAVQEFRILGQKYPGTDNARTALQKLRELGVSASNGKH